ncbi:MAG: Wzz/FepE/Etk N-terminal domain-containing protein [Balneolaceae bacterium]
MSDEKTLPENSGMKSPDENPEQKIGGETFEIDLLEQVRWLWSERKTILVVTAIFTAFGLFHYFFGPVDYESETILIQETEGGGGDLAGNTLLRTLAGGSLGIGSAVSATARGYAPPPLFLYPNIVNSTGFQQELIHRPVEFVTLDEELTLFEYFTEYHEPPFREQVYSFIRDYTIRLPFTIIRGVRNLFRAVADSDEGGEADDIDEVIEEVEDDRLLNISSSEMSVINNIRTRITLQIGAGLTTIRMRIPDPKAAALVNAILVDRIHEYMTNYRIEKAQENLEFIRGQYEEARERYEEARMELAEYQDSNRNVQSSVVQTVQADLQDRRNLAFNIYSSMSEQVEQARLTLQQQTPLFTTLEKPNIPSSPYTGASNLLLVFSIVLGFFVGIGWVYGRNFYYSYKARN